MSAREYRVSTAGRICLFGEHQDYLGLPVISCAISLRIAVEAKQTTGHEVHIVLPDIGREEFFSFNGSLPYVTERDYFRSAVNVMRREGYVFSRGLECVVRGQIPINSGTASSSALTVSWVAMLARMSEQGIILSPADCARLAHGTEVLEFGEPGGMMDHLSAAYGGITHLEFLPSLMVTPLQVPRTTFVLGDSHEPKDTRGILSRVKDNVLHASAILSMRFPGFSLAAAPLSGVDEYADDLTVEQRILLRGTLRNRDLTQEARAVFTAETVDLQSVGRLLWEHQGVLRDVLRISTARIDRMLDAAIAAGAYGGKINGSGGGGCMFALAPENPEAVAEAIERVGGTAYIVTADAGTRFEEVSG